MRVFVRGAALLTGIPVLKKQPRKYARNCGSDKSSVKKKSRGTESLEIQFLKGSVVETGGSFTGKRGCYPHSLSCLEEETISKQTPRDQYTKEQTHKKIPAIKP